MAADDLPLAGCRILLLRSGAELGDELTLRATVAQHGGQLSVNGVPALEARALTHVVAASWAAVVARAPGAQVPTSAAGRAPAGGEWSAGVCVTSVARARAARRGATTARGGFCRANREVIAARRGWLGVSWAASRQEGAAPPCISAVGVRGVHAGGQRRLGVHGLWRRT